MKTCTKCGKTKEYEAFNKGVGRDGYLAQCKQCRNERRKERGRTDYCPKRSREYKLRKVYGIEPEHYELMYKRCKGCCELCGVAEAETSHGRLCVDHNHETNEIRGLLCSSCNAALGGLQDSPQLLRKAIAYLEEKGHYGH